MLDLSCKSGSEMNISFKLKGNVSRAMVMLTRLSSTAGGYPSQFHFMVCIDLGMSWSSLISLMKS